MNEMNNEVDLNEEVFSDDDLEFMNNICHDCHCKIPQRIEVYFEGKCYCPECANKMFRSILVYDL